MAYITTVRGRLRHEDPAAAMEQHNAIVAKVEPASRPLGATGHSAFANMADPREFLAIDMWNSVEGLQRLMTDPAVQAELGSMFDGEPQITVWSSREGWRTF